MNSIVAPSVLSCDFANIQRESNMLNESEADWFHLDVMDGVFVCVTAGVSDGVTV